jgi:GntR family transcriptional repressor for pyruvate dehydrogenase complex
MKEKEKLVDQIQDKIINMIIAKQNGGENLVGDYVFNEGELAAKYEVSRSTIREVVRSLEVRGYIERVHGKGLRLIDKSQQVIARSLSDMLRRNGASYADLLEVRRIIEVQAARLAAVRATDQLEKMEQALLIMENENVPYSQYIEADFEFHNLVVEATNNVTLRALVKSYEFIIKDLIMASTKPNYRPEITKGYHRKVYECIKNRDAEGAGQAMMVHLDATNSNYHAFNDQKG